MEMREQTYGHSREGEAGTIKDSSTDIYTQSEVAQSCPTLCNPKNCSTSGLPVHLPYDPAIPFLDIYIKNQKH